MDGVVVTGASTGIGRATVEVLTRHGCHVFASVRKQADADALKQQLGDKVTPLVFDVVDEAAIARAAAKVREAMAGRTLRGLVNNAGIAVAGPLLHLPLDEFRKQMEVNVTGPFLVTKAFAPLLGTDRSLAGKPGRVVQISSVAGKRALPFMGAYAASKHAIEGMSASLRRELMPYGIDVLVIGPGAVKTPIWDKGGLADIDQYMGTDYAPHLSKLKGLADRLAKRGLDPEKIGQLVWHLLSAERPATRTSIVPNPLIDEWLPRLLPPRLVDRVVAKQLGMRPLPRG